MAPRSQSPFFAILAQECYFHGWIGASISRGTSPESDSRTIAASSPGSSTRQAATPNERASAT